MNEEKLNQFLDFLEEDTKLFSYQREFIRTIFLKSRKEPHEVFLLSVRYGRAPINEFDAAHPRWKSSTHEFSRKSGVTKIVE